ncbi:CAP domain-containing protein [Streptomyces sp. NPDC101191]|uniref:CAP domain-containing protein n=1 Tax=Streptomyces sp. NPDC101191 TaxID=3366126 RepID=UPI003823F601
MERVSDFERSVDVELIRAAQYGDGWAREQLIGAHEPLVHALAARALEGRPGADDTAVRAIVRDTLHRAEFALGTLTSPDAFRPWLIGIGVATVLAHATGLPLRAAPDACDSDPACWLDVEDAVLAALWSLEQDGLLGRDETAAALNWAPQYTELRYEELRARISSAQSVTIALVRFPRCPLLDDRLAGWDGYPGAAWRDELAQHTVYCGYCATGFAEAAGDGTRPAFGTAASGADGSAAWAVGAPYSFGTAGAAGGTGPEALAPTGAIAAPQTLAATPVGGAGHHVRAGSDPAAAVSGRQGTRAARRRRRQADERTRRRVVVAAGLAVVAVTGGAFTLNAGRGGSDLLEANRAAAPDLDAGLTNEPGALTSSASPSTSTSASPSTSASAATARTPGASKTPATTPGKAPRPTTATGAPERPTTSATTPAARRKAAATRGTDAGRKTGTQQDPGRSSVADQVIALVNAERAKAGCGALTPNATLTRAAQGHSDDMAARDFFDHTNPDGASPGDRVTAAGYPWSTYGENIAMGQSSAEQVMESWMNSPGHRANILNCDFKEIGVGIHDSGGPYWTQVFGAR